MLMFSPTKYIRSYFPAGLADRLFDVKPHYIDVFKFIDKILDYYLGTDCIHEHQHLCLVLPVDETGYLDVGKAHELIESINVGRKPDCLVRICPDCLRVKRIFNKK